MPRRRAPRRPAIAHARVSAAELAAWQAKAAAAGVSLSELLRQAMARTQTWTAPAREVERERTRQIARIGSNLNQIARWARAMLIKFIARGTGSAQAAADYLTRERDSQGEVRDDVADTLAFEHKYTSGVIAWAPEDQPSDQAIDRVLDEFEQSTWAGLAPDRYAWAAVQHRTANGGVHVHVLAARCDLETGKSLNIAPPGWEKTFDPLRDAFNAEHGWSRPDDPALARVQQPGHRAYVEAAQLRAGLALEPAPRDLIRDYLLQRVEHGTVRNRADVVAALQEAGLEVPRQGKNYLTAMDPTTGDRWRLKGELYAHDFQRERLDRAVAETAGDRTPGDRGIDRERDRAARRELAARREQRAAYHRSRYGGGDRANARAAAKRLAPAPGSRPEPLAWHLRRELGDDALAVDAHPGPDPDGRRPRSGHRGSPPDPDAARGRALGGSRFGRSRGSGSWCCRPARWTIRP